MTRISLIERLRGLATPHQSRWQPMLAGLALFAAGAGAAVLLEAYDFLAAIMTGLALAAWAMGACALIGYVRWMFAAEVKRAKDDSP